MARTPWQRVKSGRENKYKQYVLKVFGYLTVLSIDNLDGRPNCTVSCRCGMVRSYYLWDVVAGRRLSCGCLKSGSKERERAMRYQQEQQAVSDGWRMVIKFMATPLPEDFVTKQIEGVSFLEDSSTAS